MYKNAVIVGLFLLLTCHLTVAQEKQINKKHAIALKTQFIQIKDDFNYGLVYNGLNLAVEYSFTRSAFNKTFMYSPALGFGPTFNKGVGLFWYFKPIDVFYGFKINSSDTRPFSLGAYFAIDHKWQQYPYLQGGHLFWFSSIEIGPKFSYQFPVKKSRLIISFSNSIAGWNSRPVPSTETYYYSFSFSDFFTSAYSNIKFGSFNLFNHTRLKVEFLRQEDNRLSFAYEFEYYAYFEDPEVKFMSHSLNLIWKLGKSTKENQK